MTDSPMSDELNQVEMAIDQYLSFLDGARERPSLSELDPSTRKRVQDLIVLIDATWDTHVEPNTFQPLDVAASIAKAGETVVMVSGNDVRMARTKLGIDVRELAAQLNAAGLDFSIRQLVHLERSSAVEISSTAAEAIARALSISVDRLLASNDRFVRYVFSDDVNDLVNTWAERNNMDPISLGRSLRDRVLVGHRRSKDEGDKKAWESLVIAVLSSLVE